MPLTPEEALRFWKVEDSEHAGFDGPPPTKELMEQQMKVKLLEIELQRAKLRLEIFDQQARRDNAGDERYPHPR